MMKKLFSLSAFLFFLSQASLAAVIPTDAVNVARDFLARQMSVSPLEIGQSYSIDWGYLIIYEDDQPVIVKFTGLENICEVRVASQTLRVLEYSCRPSQGIEFNQSPGCGAYDGSFITLSAPQDETTCRQIAAEKGLLKATVMSYCSAGREVDVFQMSFVDACKEAFRGLKGEK